MISLGHGAALLVVSSSMAHLALYLTEDRGYSQLELRSWPASFRSSRSSALRSGACSVTV